MVRLLQLALLLYIIYLMDGGGVTATQVHEKYQEYCQFEDFNVTCNRDEIIMMEHARYGRMQLGRCVSKAFGYIGCSTTVMDYVDSQCSGQRHCTFPISSLRNSMKPCPPDLTAYMEAEYTCVKVLNSPSHYCGRGGSKMVSEDSGFISSAVTNPTSAGSHYCPLHLHAKPGQHVNLTLYSFQHTGSPQEDCSLYAVVEDGPQTHELPLCGTAQRRTDLYKSRSSSLRVHFSTKGNANVKDHNVLLKYEVTDCPDLVAPSNMWVERYEEKLIVKCNHSQETWYLTCEGTEWLGTVTNCSESQPLNSNTTRGVSHPFPFGLIIAITIGVVLGVTVGTVMLVSVFVYRRRRRKSRRPVKSNTLLGDETSQENEENYARRFMQDYNRGGGSPGSGSRCPHGSSGHHYHHHPGGDYAQMLELRCASAPVTNGIYSERRPLATSQPTLPVMAGFSLQKLGLSSSSFATFKPTSGPYDKVGTYESRLAMQSVSEHENRFIFDAEPDGPLSPDQQPDLVPNNHAENTVKETESSDTQPPADTCRHFSLYGQHRQPPAVSRVSNI